MTLRIGTPDLLAEDVEAYCRAGEAATAIADLRALFAQARNTDTRPLADYRLMMPADDLAGVLDNLARTAGADFPVGLIVVTADPDAVDGKGSDAPVLIRVAAHDRDSVFGGAVLKPHAGSRSLEWALRPQTSPDHGKAMSLARGSGLFDMVRAFRSREIDDREVMVAGLRMLFTAQVVELTGSTRALATDAGAVPVLVRGPGRRDFALYAAREGS